MVTVYKLAVGDAVNETVAELSPGVATTLVGATVGGPKGETAVDGEDDADDPVEFTAITVNLYAVPLVNPVTIIGLDVPVTMIAPGDDVTLYEVARLDPVKARLTLALPGVATTLVGTGGAGEGVTAVVGGDTGDVPETLVADMVKV